MTEKRFKNNGTLIFDNKTPLNTFEVVDKLNELHEENKELRLQLNLCSDQRNEFHRGARENANRVGKLEKENEQLKARITYLERKIQRERVSAMKQHEKWENEIQDFQNLLTEREETFLKPIHLALDDAIENERTALGKSALKQFKQTIME